MIDENLVKILEGAGLTRKEALVYLALLEFGQANVTDISKLTDLKRSIIYVILEGLIKRGYASEILGKKINTYQAIDPSVILGQLKEVSRNFSEMLPIFRTLGSHGKKKPKIRYYDTREGILKVWDNEMNNAKESFFISSYKRIEDFFPGKINEWLEKAHKGIVNVGFRHLVSGSRFELDLAEKFLAVNQEVRILPDLLDPDMDFTIYDNKLAITSLEENPFIIVIESEALVASMRPIFEILWEKGVGVKDFYDKQKTRYV